MSHKTPAVSIPLKSPRRVGVVESDKRLKTRTVVVNFVTKHPKYGKFLKRQKKFKAHDAGNKHQIGEIVEIVETKPISKDKRFVIKEK